MLRERGQRSIHPLASDLQVNGSRGNRLDTQRQAISVRRKQQSIGEVDALSPKHARNELAGEYPDCQDEHEQYAGA